MTASRNVSAWVAERRVSAIEKCRRHGSRTTSGAFSSRRSMARSALDALPAVAWALAICADLMCLSPSGWRVGVLRDRDLFARPFPLRTGRLDQPLPGSLRNLA